MRAGGDGSVALIEPGKYDRQITALTGQGAN
jgi:hypothetical protein